MNCMDWCMHRADRPRRVFPWEVVQKEPVRLERRGGRRSGAFLKATLKLKAGVLGLM